MMKYKVEVHTRTSSRALLIAYVFANFLVDRVTCILGGDDAQDGQFTYQVSIQDEIKQNICGGGILSNEFILTAAHCVIDENTGKFRKELLTVVIGTVNLNDPDTFKLQILVEKIFIPVEYEPQLKSTARDYRPMGDIAVLKLTESIGLNDHPRFTTLQTPRFAFTGYVGGKATIAGFGYNSIEVLEDPVTRSNYERGESFGRMRFAKAVVVSNVDCGQIMPKKIHKTNICARVEQRDETKPEGVCIGDSGGPLVIGDNTVIGVLSSSPAGCSEAVGLGVYTRVTSYQAFIRSAMNDEKTEDMRLGVWYLPDGSCLDAKPILVEMTDERMNNVNN